MDIGFVTCATIFVPENPHSVLSLLCAVHLIDSHYCVDPAKYVAMLLLSLKTMLQLGLPHVNVLSKVDLMESYGRLGNVYVDGRR